MNRKILSVFVVFAMIISLIATAHAIGYLDGSEAPVIGNPGGADIVPTSGGIDLAVTTQTYPTPAGYSDNDYQKLVEFFLQWDYSRLGWDLTDPLTWRYKIYWNDGFVERIDFCQTRVSGKLNLSNFTALKSFHTCENDTPVEIIVSDCPMLEELEVSDDSIYFSNLPALRRFSANSNLTELPNLENLQNLEFVDVRYNLLDLTDPKIQESIAKIQATVDKNGGDFYYTPQRTPEIPPTTTPPTTTTTPPATKKTNTPPKPNPTLRDALEMLKFLARLPSVYD